MYRKLQQDLDAIIDWCFENGLKINSDKTKSMITTTNTRLKGDVKRKVNKWW